MQMHEIVGPVPPGATRNAPDRLPADPAPRLAASKSTLRRYGAGF
jgi:hypothetical protein